MTGRAIPFLMIMLCASGALAQSTPGPSTPGRSYSFVVLDSPPRLFTMRQVDQDYLSGYRLFTRLSNTHLKPAFSFLIQGVASALLFNTMTHEEGHQSILTGLGIASASRSFLFMTRSGYVDGVTDQTLKNLRDTKFPTFIRLHTAGFESDYMLATREETLLSFEDETYSNLVVDYLLRKFALISYFTEGIFKRDSDGAEETNELQRDIVGNDLYGVIRHLYRPTMEYQRYTRFADLTDEEHRYLQRIQWRTFLNLVNPNVVGIRNVRITDDLKANVGLGHCMGPFGDFVDEKIWLAYRRTLNVNVYLREFETRDHWFFGAGAGITHYQLAPRVSVSASVHYWRQPLDLSFTTGAGKSGGALDVIGSYQLPLAQKSSRKNISLDVGLVAKTPGFLPEETALGRHVGFRVGLSISFSARPPN